MAKRTDYFLTALTVIAWIIFIGLCIEAGGYLTNTIFTLFINPEGAKKFWMQIDLSKLYQYNQSRYVTLTSIMVIIAVLKAWMFYYIVKIFYDKKVDLSRPFNEAMNRFIFKTAYLAMGIAFFSFWGAGFSRQLSQQGIQLPDTQQLKMGGADVWLFMGVTLLVIAFIFKKGVEIQNENDLTV